MSPIFGYTVRRLELGNLLHPGNTFFSWQKKIIR